MQLGLLISIGILFVASICSGAAVENNKTKSSDDETCNGDYKKLEKCYLTELSSRIESKTDEYKKRIDKCFTSHHGCDAPDFDENPLAEMPRVIRKLAEKVKVEWERTPIVVKQCIRKNITGEIGGILAKCLEKRGIRQINISQLAEVFAQEGGIDLFEAFLNEKESSNNTSKGFLLGRLNIARALRECDEKQHGGKIAASNNTQSLDQCARDVLKEAKEDFCDATAQCRKTVSKSCNTRAERIYQSACDCKYEKILDAIIHLDDLRAKKRAISANEMIQAVGMGENPQKYIQAIDECFTSNGYKTPDVIRVIKQLTKTVNSSPAASTASTSTSTTKKPAVTTTKKGGHKEDSDDDLDLDWGKSGSDKTSSTQAATVDMSIVNTIRDFLASQAFNKDECIPCSK